MKILTLSTFPFEKPEHGGQHRVANIVRVLREAGHQVQSAGVLGGDLYKPVEYFCEYPGPALLQQYISNPWLMEDWAIGRLYEGSNDFYAKLAEQIEPNPDLIWVEHPWLVGFARRFIDEKKLNKTVLIYGSANIEHRLKYEILSQYFTEEDAATARDLILDAEVKALRQADGVCGVSQQDLSWMQTFTSTKCVLAANGVANRPTTMAGLEQANKITLHRKTALLCASAHPPNMRGFFNIFGAGVGCIAPDESLVLAGGVGPAVMSDPQFSKIAGLARATISAGIVSDECLQGLLAIAHVIILPITHGGGTNLKTAEALWAGKNIVATSVAMRGFEQFSQARGVWIANDGPSFVAALRHAMESPPLHLTNAEVAERGSVLWDQTLREMVDYVGSFGDYRYV